MWKKVLIAVVAVVVGLALVKGTWVGSHVRHALGKVRKDIRESVPPEQEISRLRAELQSLKLDDDKHLDQVARLDVKVTKLEKDVASHKTALDRHESRIVKIKDELGASEFVLHQGNKVTKDDLRSDALAFEASEKELKAKELELAAQKKILALEKQKLADLRNTRTKMSAELAMLEATLAEEKHAEATRERTIDDSKYQRIRKDMESVRERIEVLKKKRELRGELKLDTPEEKNDDRNNAADKFLEARFGNKKVADGK